MDSDSEDGMPLSMSDFGDTVVDEPTQQDVLESLGQDLCQIEGEDQSRQGSIQKVIHWWKSF